MTPAPDRWSQWLLERRHGGDDRQREATLAHLGGIRDRVLAGAEPLDGATLLDVGAGDGLIGLAALDRVGPSGSVVFADVSPALLDECRRLVAAKDAGARARFIIADAIDLGPIPSDSVDVVTTRSVLIYIPDKRAAFAAMCRVLRPGGRISLFEPINRLMYPEPAGRFLGCDVSAVADLAEKVKASLTVLPAGTDYRDAMMGFDDRDLADHAVAAGFSRVHVECHIDVEPGAVMDGASLSALLDTAPNPNAPTTREAIESALTPDEQHRFIAEFERAIDAGTAIRKMAVAYLVAHK
ncbi:MAG: class I SAM-dependent methyltransferase [Solirubrobacteraceae bacterium]